MRTRFSKMWKLFLACQIWITLLPTLSGSEYLVDVKAKPIELDYSNRNLKEIPNSFPGVDAGTVKMLNLGSNKLHTCPSRAFANFTSLERLIISNNKIKNFSSECFFGLEVLKYLDLQGNPFLYENLPRDIFNHVPSLTALVIIPSESWQSDYLTLASVLRNLSKIEELYFTSSYQLSDIPYVLSSLNVSEMRKLVVYCTGYIKILPAIPNIQNTLYVDETVVIGEYYEISSFPLHPQVGFLRFSCFQASAISILSWMKDNNIEFNVKSLAVEEAYTKPRYEDKLDTMCPGGGNLEYLSLRSIDLHFLKNMQLVNGSSCLSNLSHLNIAYTSPPTVSKYTRNFRALLPGSLKVLDAAYLFPRSLNSIYNQKYCFYETQWNFQEAASNNGKRVPDLSKYSNMSRYDILNTSIPRSSFVFPRSLEVLYLDNAALSFDHLGDTVYVHPDNTIRFLNVSNTFHMEYVHWTVIGLNQLQVIDMGSNDIVRISPNVFQYMFNLRSLNLTNNKMESVNGMLKYATNLVELDLSFNKFQSFKSSQFQLLKQLSKLFLQNNLIESVFIAWVHLPKVIYLDLSNNKFARVQTSSWKEWNTVAETRTELKLLLNGNSIRLSTCENLDLHVWMRGFSKITNYLQERLSDGITIEAQKQMCRHPVNYTVIIILSCVLLILLVIVSVLLRWFRWHIKWYMYKFKLMAFQSREKSEIPMHGMDYVWDAFVAHNHTVDYNWVLTSFLPKVETEWGHKMCIGYRNFIPGSVIAANVIQAVEDSRKVIFVITPAFLQSSWCEFELHMALVGGKGKILIILKEPIHECKVWKSLTFLMRDLKYFEWTDNHVGQRLFWEQLHNCLSEDD